MDYELELERVEQSISYIEEAIDYLRLTGSMEYVIEELKDRLRALKVSRGAIHRAIETQDAEDEAALEREYYAALM